MSPVVVKVTDEGTSEPFIARMYFQIFELRDAGFREEETRLGFDGCYSPVLQSLSECRQAFRSAMTIIEKHLKDIQEGTVVRRTGDVVHIDQSIDLALGQAVKDFFIKGEMAVQGLTGLSDFIDDLRLGALFGKEKKFEKEKAKVLASPRGQRHSWFLDYVESSRNGWYAEFNNVRNAIEHRGFVLSRVRYICQDDGVKVLLPVLDNMDTPLADALTIFWKCLFDFVETVVVHVLATNLRPPLIIEEIPKDRRDATKPIRYRVTVDPRVVYA